MVSRSLRFARWWRRSGRVIRVALLLLVIVAISSYSFWQYMSDEVALARSGLLVFLLVNLNIVVLCVLAFLVGRNIVKLIFDRRRRILGSRLKMRLVVAFVGLTLVPSAILFFLASGLLTSAMEGWFSTQIEQSVDGAVEVARLHYNNVKEQMLLVGKQTAREVRRRAVDDNVASLLEEQRKERGLFSLRLLDFDGEEVAGAHTAAAFIEPFTEPPLDTSAVERALAGESSVLLEEQGASQFVRAYVPYKGMGGGAMVSSTRIDPDFAHALALVKDSFEEYEQLKILKNPLRTSYLLTFAMITGLILFAAIWFAFYIAREIAVPIQRLAEGTVAVARGNLDLQIRVAGDDEIGFLVQSFNRMTSDLKLSRDDAERRRVYLETILANLAVGVIALDTQRRITSINAAAAQLYGIENFDDRGIAPAVDADSRHERSLAAVLNEAQLAQILPLLEELEQQHGEGPPRVREREFTLESGGQELKIVCTAGRIMDSHGGWVGTILLFDDITELSRAQHMAAWREVARRIAHEIKNPLTPIQLSAQRLERLLADSPLAPTVRECSQTIVEHVASIKRLANEFSRFARMPTAQLEKANLNTLLADTVAPFAEHHPNLSFQFIGDARLPEVVLDREQIRRVLINLVDNAVAALSASLPGSDSEPGRVVVKTLFDPRRGTAGFEVSDNGPGVPEGDRLRIFEPYYTTKEEGSGLGLAIVRSILADHQGEIRVYENTPRGARFVVELPLTPEPTTQRRLVTTTV